MIGITYRNYNGIGMMKENDGMVKYNG
jgi:hypothetical protein